MVQQGGHGTLNSKYAPQLNFDIVKYNKMARQTDPPRFNNSRNKTMCNSHSLHRCCQTMYTPGNFSTSTAITLTICPGVRYKCK